MLRLCFFILVVLAGLNKVVAQSCVTAPATFEYQIDGDAGFNNSSVDITFDSASDYIGGKTIFGAATVRISVGDDGTVPDCGWRLRMSVSNTGGVVPSDEWNTLSQYGVGTLPVPQIDIMSIRVTNSCNTPDVLTFQTFNDHGDIIAIIDNPPAAPPDRIDAGPCDGSEVDGPGTWLSSNYGEFTFQVDFKVQPGFISQPGIYQLAVVFTLDERQI